MDLRIQRSRLAEINLTRVSRKEVQRERACARKRAHREVQLNLPTISM